MIELWTCGNHGEGEVGHAATPLIAARFAMSKAVESGTLARTILKPGDNLNLTPTGDTSPQRLVVHGEHLATMFEVSPYKTATHAGGASLRQLLIGMGGLPCVPVFREEAPDDDLLPGMRLFWIAAHAESTPIFDDFRSLLQTQA